MLRRAWKPLVGATVVVGVPTYAYFRYTQRRQETFDLSVRERGPDGKPVRVTRSFPLLSKAEVEARLTEHAESVSTRRPSGIVWKQSTAFLASNSPIEDANASGLVEKEASPTGDDLLFFAVMDGHGGYHTSRLLSKTLIPSVTLELDTLKNAPSVLVPKGGFLHSLKSLFWPTAAVPPQGSFDADPTYVSLTIQTAFANLDSEIMNAPLRILSQALAQPGVDKTAVPDLSQHPMALAAMFPALSGSCALMAMFDTAHRNLYIACTGDSRAVAGVWEETADGKGVWRVDVLSEDQTGRNPNELRRMQSEHPPEEANAIISRGRIFGGLEVVRAFGDARYKWSKDIQALLYKVFMEGNKESMRTPSPLLRTPPYVTPRPVITHRKLYGLPLSSPDSENPNPRSTLRFVVLATDGLWDELTSEEVVALVGGHLAGLKGIIPKNTLPTLVPTLEGEGKTLDGKAARDRSDEKGSWAFVDENVSTHLIRNAFGGGDEEQVRKLLSIPANLSRSYRDDVTCTVVWWEDGREEEAKTTTFTKSS
ncbi:phosphatase 2C-like domain-containing protein [Cristinia sonorae]|uniref:Phosphatase 2C-like domain-containing protein n=1 Tax=Cristinia sonorae TaxID=1940300 RepID=A0A8K0UJS1_9AGAR|nr:phosphatase 2C-like domain-containing protein [Cristinia sonorae]